MFLGQGAGRVAHIAPYTDSVYVQRVAKEDALPAKKRKVNLPDGRTIEATVMPFQTSNEPWNEYLVEDGSVIKVKLVTTEVLRVDGEHDPQGNPVYLTQSTNIMAVSAPDHLRKEGT